MDFVPTLFTVETAKSIFRRVAALLPSASNPYGLGIAIVTTTMSENPGVDAGKKRLDSVSGGFSPASVKHSTVSTAAVVTLDIHQFIEVL